MSRGHAQPRFLVTSEWIKATQSESALLGRLDFKDNSSTATFELRSLQNKAPGLYLTMPDSQAGSRAIASTLAAAKRLSINWSLTRAGQCLPTEFRSGLSLDHLTADIQDEILKWHREAWNK